MKRNSYGIGEVKIDVVKKNVVVEKEVLVSEGSYGGFRISIIINKLMNNVFSISDKFKLNIEKRIVEEGNNLKLNESDGNEYLFNVKDGNTYISEKYSGKVIRKTTTGYVVYDEEYNEEIYDLAGRIKEVKDRLGNIIYTYTYTNNKLTRFSSVSGNSIEIEYGTTTKVKVLGNVALEVNGNDILIGNVNYNIEKTIECLRVKSLKSGIEKNKIELIVGTDTKIKSYKNSVLKKSIRIEEVGSSERKIKLIDETLGKTTVYRVNRFDEILHHYEEGQTKFLESPTGDSRCVNDIYLDKNKEYIGKIKEERKVNMFIDEASTTNMKYSCYVESLAWKVDTYLLSFWVKKLDIEEAYVSVTLAQNNVCGFYVESMNNEWDLVTKVIRGIGTGNLETEINVSILKDEEVEIKDLRINLVEDDIKTLSPKIRVNEKEYDLGNVEVILSTEEAIEMGYSDLIKLQKQTYLTNINYVTYDDFKSVKECNGYKIKIAENNTVTEYEMDEITIVGVIEGKVNRSYENKIELEGLCQRVYLVEGEERTLLKEEIYNKTEGKITTKDDEGVEQIQKLNSRKQISESILSGLQARTTTYNYNNKYLLIKEESKSNNIVIESNTYEYEDLGKIRKITTKNNEEESLEYSLGNVSKSKINNIHEIEYSYAEDMVTSYEQDILKYNIEYENDKIKKVYQGEKLLVEYVYENNELEISKRIYTSATEYYTNKEYYDKYGRIIKKSKIVSGVETVIYEAKYNIGTLITKDTIINNESALLEEETVGNDITKYEYVKGTNRINKIEEGQNVKTINYDKLNRVQTIVDNNETETYSYKNEVDNRIENIIKNEGTSNYGQINYVYDSAKRVISEEKIMLGKSYKKVYEYKQIGNCSTNLVSKVTNYKNGVIEDTEEYSYDNKNNLIEVRKGQVLKKKYTYDSLKRLIREDDADFNTSQTYEYDNRGNILKKQKYLYSTGELSTLLEEKEYNYSGSANQLTSYDGESTNVNYEGNSCKIGKYILSYTQGKLTTCGYVDKLKGSPSYTFTYDNLGRRTKKSYMFLPGRQALSNYVTSQTNNYVYRNGKLVEETIETVDNDLVKTNVKLEYKYINGELVGYNRTINNVTTKYIYGKNMLGDIEKIYDTSGNVVGEYVYDAWGNSIKKVDIDSAAEYNPFRYRGYYYDVETGLFWCNSRYYNPEWGRWISPDSIEYLDPESINGLNLYAYCGNDPVNRYDPSGHAWDWAQFGRGLIAVGIAAAVVAAVAVITVVSGGSAVPVLVGAAIGAGISGGVSLGCQLVSTGEINIGQLLTDMAIGGVSGAFGGSALGTLGMTIAGTSTGFLGSVAGDLVSTGSFDSINWGAAVWSGILGGVISGVGGAGAQHGKLGGVLKYSNRLNTIKQKGITGRYLSNTAKCLAREKRILINAANQAIYKSIPYTIGTSILDYYL